MTVRRLTTGEITLAKSVFGDSIDYARVRIHDTRVLPTWLQNPHRAMALLNNLSFPGTSASADFSRETPQRQALFIHEMTHVWQHQNRVLSTLLSFIGDRLRNPFSQAAAYRHLLMEQKDLTQYRMEPQACIIQDHFLLSRFNISAAHRDARRNGADEKLLPLYDSILENFKADPGYARRRHFPLF